MTEEKTRVEFNAPKSPVERADSVGEILGREKARMQLLWDAFDRTPAGPRLDGELPGDKALYDGEILEWTGSHPPGSTDDSQV